MPFTYSFVFYGRLGDFQTFLDTVAGYVVPPAKRRRLVLEDGQVFQLPFDMRGHKPDVLPFYRQLDCFSVLFAFGYDEEIAFWLLSNGVDQCHMALSVSLEFTPRYFRVGFISRMSSLSLLLQSSDAIRALFTEMAHGQGSLFGYFDCEYEAVSLLAQNQWLDLDDLPDEVFNEWEMKGDMEPYLEAILAHPLLRG